MSEESSQEQKIEEACAEERVQVARKLALAVLRERFGVLPRELTERVEAMDSIRCEDLMKRAVHVTTVEDL